MNQWMKGAALLWAVALGGAALAGCGDSTGGGSNQTCTEEHQCSGGACMCTAGPKKDSSCCDPSDSQCKGTSNACDTYCKVCM